MSIRKRLLYGYLLSIVLIVIPFSGAIYWFVENHLQYIVTHQLQQDMAIIDKTLHDYPTEFDELGQPGYVELFKVTRAGAVIYSSSDWEFEDLDHAIPPRGSAPLRRALTGDHQAYLILEKPISVGADSFIASVAHPVAGMDNTLTVLRQGIIAGLSIALVLALLGGFIFTQRVLSPFQRLANKAKTISSANLSERLPMDDPADEFGHLAQVFNDTFARLEQSFEQLKRFTQDVSHELRTPLTILRGIGEQALTAPEDNRVTREALGTILEEIDRLSNLVESLLTLSRIESGHYPLNKTRHDLCQLSTEVVECLRILADEKHQSLRIETEPPILLEIDVGLMRQAIMNLVYNAIQYTPVNGRINVKVFHRSQHIAIEVSDDGPGIATVHHSRIFERFYRVHSDRSRATGGAGLGLAITAWIAKIHVAQITLENNPTAGVTFRIRWVAPTNQ